MKFQIARESMYGPLQFVTSVVERRQVLPLLSHVLIEARADGITLVASDLEVELAVVLPVVSCEVEGAMTVPAKKLLDILRCFQDGTSVFFSRQGKRVSIECGHFKSCLMSLSADEFPRAQAPHPSLGLSLPVKDFGRLLTKCAFAMAHQDVRFFFNGLLLQVDGTVLRAVATNGQRLATSTLDVGTGSLGKGQFIIPRKAVLELMKLLSGTSDETIELTLSDSQLRAVTSDRQLVSNLIDGDYPDYRRAIPHESTGCLTGTRSLVRDALSRAAILSHEVHRNVRLGITADELVISANNPLQEEAVESLSVAFEGEGLEIAFNVNYLLDSLDAIEGEALEMRFTNAKTAAVIRGRQDECSLFIVSPMIL